MRRILCNLPITLVWVMILLIVSPFFLVALLFEAFRER